MNYLLLHLNIHSYLGLLVFWFILNHQIIIVESNKFYGTIKEFSKSEDIRGWLPKGGSYLPTTAENYSY